MHVHIFTEVKCEMSKAEVFPRFVQVPLQPFFGGGSVSKRHRTPATIWTGPSLADTTMYTATRSTMIDRMEKWSLSELWQLGIYIIFIYIYIYMYMYIHKHLNTLEKPHDRQVCADLAAANPCGTWTGGNGLVHNDRGQFVSFGWVKPAKIMWNSEPCIEKQQCFVRAQGCNKKDLVTILATMVFMSRPQESSYPEPMKCRYSFGQPTSTDLTIDLVEMHSGFTMHGICTSKAACFIIMFGELLYQVVHPAFIVWGSACFDHRNLFCHCVCCVVLGFAMQLHSMLFTFIHLYVGVCIMCSRSMNSLPSFFGRSCAVQMIPATVIEHQSF